ncbi:amidohydrolase family protein [Saccharicrinis aurantiacus]|uniref:amidohydrolase family protein n=1 Tax=Saccharicrinis aurantiacus TaxID=1849719 RepID=UPI00083932FB|nr:amidohydrolase family protein [Saccharicrinis aurantiacus]
MKILKRLLSIVLIFMGILFIAVVVILFTDTLGTKYLETEKSEIADNKSFLIVNANIIPMSEDTTLNNKMVYIKDGIITAIDDIITVSDIEVVNAKGAYLMPGLIDMHVHLWDRYELGLYLSNGVTAIRNVWGMPMHLRIKSAINNNEILAPSFYTSGPKLTGPEFIGDDNLNLSNPKEGMQKVISYKERGYDFIKTYYGLPEDIFAAIIKQASISNMDIIAHVSQKVPYSYHFNPQILSIEHAEDIVQRALNYQLDTLSLNQIVTDFRNSPHTSFCPTLMAFYNIYNMLIDEDILSSEDVELMNPSIQLMDSKSQFERWQTSKQEDATTVDRIKNQHDFHLLIIQKLNAAGVNIICGTDAGIGVTIPGASIHQELAFYKEAGLTNYEVLKTATLNASKVHKMMNNMGSIEIGKVANLLLLEDNPLTDLSALKQPQIVFINGQKLERDTLNYFEKKARNRSNLIATILRYIENLILENSTITE